MAEPEPSPSLQILSQIPSDRATPSPSEQREITRWEPSHVPGYPQPHLLTEVSNCCWGLRLICPDGCCGLTQGWDLSRNRRGSASLWAVAGIWPCAAASMLGRAEGAGHLAECRCIYINICIYNLPPACSWRGSAHCRGLCSTCYWAHPTQTSDAPNRYLFMQHFRVNFCLVAFAARCNKVLVQTLPGGREGTSCFAPPAHRQPGNTLRRRWSLLVSPQHLLWEPPDARDDIFKSVRLF